MAALTICAALFCAAIAAASKPPNIIFILADDLGYGDIQVAQDVNRTYTIPTPNIQRMADNGIRFPRGYSGQVCAPSRCSLMTGRHSGHCTIRGNDGSYSPLLKSDVTVAKALQGTYSTALFGKWGLGNFGTDGYPTEQGFDIFIGQDSQIACHNWYPHIIQNNSDGQCAIVANADASNATCGPGHSNCEWANDLYARETVNYIRTHANDDKPFLLYFSTTTPHEGALKGANTDYPTPWPYSKRFPEFPEASDLHNFATAVSAQDDMVGAVLDELEQQGIAQDTVVFFSGDNGPDHKSLDYFDDTGPFRGKKRSLNEGGIRQTILAQWPGQIPANSSSQHLFTFWDFLPTAVDLAGVDLPRGVDGISGKNALLGNDGEQQPHDYLYWEFCCYDNTDGTLPTSYNGGWGQALRWDAADGTEWKLIRVDRTEVQLFNLTADISESNDLSASYSDLIQQGIDWMEKNRREIETWPSNYNTSMKCCNACYNPDGCPAPCVQKPSPPSPSPCQQASNNSIPLGELNGVWEQSETVTYILQVDRATSTVQLATTHCPKCCWNTGNGTVSADGRHLSIVAKGEECTRTLTGDVCDTGNQLKIVWSEHWHSWSRQQAFDFD